MISLVAFSLIFAAPGAAPSYFDRLPRCGSATAPIDEPCTLPSRVSERTTQRLLHGRERAWWLSGDQLTLVARFGEEGWAMLCCAIQTPLEPIGDSGIGAITVRVPHVEEALLDAGVVRSSGVAQDYLPPEPVPTVRPPRPPARSEPLRGTISSLVIHSTNLAEDRPISVYVPAGTAPGVRLPVIYLADGDTAGFAPILEAAIDAGQARPAMIVGIRSGQGPASGCRTEACDQRMLEYLILANPTEGAPDSVFSRHLRFVTEEVIPLIERDFPASPRAEDRIAAGYSNGGAWALATVILRPELFRNALAMSAGAQWAVDHAAPLRGARIYAGAGLFEPGFLRRTRAAAAAAEAAGAEVRMRELASGHTRAMWQIMFADAITWLLPRR